MFSKILIGRLPPEDSSDWPETLPKYLSDDPQHSIFWRWNFFFPDFCQSHYHTIIRSYDHMIIWSYESLIIWSYDHVIIRSCDRMIIWSYDHMIISSCHRAKIQTKFGFQGRKMKCWGSSETRFGQVSGQSEPCSGGKRPLKVRSSHKILKFWT